MRQSEISTALRSLLAMTQLYKGRFREIAHTRNAPPLSLESQRHFPRSVGGISLDYATKYTLLRSVYFATLRGVRRKYSGSAEDVI